MKIHSKFLALALTLTSFSTISADDDVAWPVHGGTNKEQRFSPLDKINTDNVADLSLAWYVDLPEARGQEATPLVVDGVMYTSAAWSHVYAINPVSGEVIWHFDPKIDKSYRIKGCCGPVNRGVAYDNGMVFIGAFDGHLIALDAKTGKQKWSTLTVDQSQSYTITGAPRVANGKVFIGNGGAEFGVRGYVSAYDQQTGELVWRFYTVPGDPNKPQESEILEMAAKTWAGDYYKLGGGGGTVWDTITYDPDTNLVIFGVGNGSPWNPRIRSAGKGDNLFLSSIVAVDADSGEYKWHYQTTPQEGWDYTATQNIIFTEMMIDGEMRKVLMQAPKNGYFYVLDRQTGEFLSAKNFVPVNWATHIDENGKAHINPEAQYWNHKDPKIVMPSTFGAHNWHPMSYNPNLNLVYIPAHEIAFPYQDEPGFKYKTQAVNLGSDMLAPGFPENPEVRKMIKAANKGHLAAWDPVKQEEVWRVQYPGPWNGGTLATAGELVFQGSAAGFLNAYDGKTGAKLWQYPVQTGIVAPPISYSIDGEQYITVSAGWGGIFPLLTGPLTRIAKEHPVNVSRLLTFKLGGNKTLPELQLNIQDLPDMSAVTVDPEVKKKGHWTYEYYCSACHGTSAVSGGVTPDLRFTPVLPNKDLWQAVVHDGALKQRGMVPFGNVLSREEIEQIRQYIITQNQYARKQGDTVRYTPSK
ncbi:PQQ-dependent dehydrogenase, methanol/ethanol family [Alteromonas sp. ZYF713]|nr:PQQ-dependent dehydrogenase, methanol/ethanol family [Alteromonas sp. ZYF713]